MAVSSRGVLGGAKRMRQKSWRQIRAERIAEQKRERDERRAAAAEEAEEEEEEDDDDRPTRRTKARTKRRTGKLKRSTGRVLFGFRIPEMNGNRWTAVLIWLIGAFLTRSFVMQLGVPEEIASPIAILLQWLLTKAESPLWQGRGRPPIAIIATIIDGGVNTGGTWVYTKNIGKTDFWAMIQYAAENPRLVPAISAQIAIAASVGVLTAAAAEYFWNLE